MAKILKTIIGMAILIILIKLVIMSWFMYLYYHKPLISSGSAKAIKIQPGWDVDDLANALNQRHLFKHPRFFIFIARHTKNGQHLRYGEYWIKPGMSANALLNHVLQGTGLVRHHITFIEGWTFKEMKEALVKNADLKHELKTETNREIMAQLKSPYKKPEGLFFPSTYYFLWGDTDVDILERAYKKMQTFLNEAWTKRAKKLPYHNAYQALIVASLIEKETSVKKERPIIAGVILSRLNQRMRLQVDPTVLYGVGKPYGSTITKADLLSKTPYNTYYIYGLPPTPIDMPSASSILAALHPEKHNYLYYVSKGDGTHQFSSTYKEHLKAIERYHDKEKLQRLKEKLLNYFSYRNKKNTLFNIVEWMVQTVG